MSRKTKILLTRRAIADLQEIYDYSVSRWTVEVADAYLSDIESALIRCSENPGLLLPRASLHPALRFYVVKRHLLVCDVIEESIVVLTISNARMDLVKKLDQMQPTLREEIEILRRLAEEGRT